MSAFSVRVLLFARYADLLGREELHLSVRAGATVADVVAAVRALPGGGQIPARPLVAVNLDQAPLQTPVRPSDVLALLPPLAGG